MPSPKFQVKFSAPGIVGKVNCSGEQTVSDAKFKLKAAAGWTVTSRVVASEHPKSSCAVKVTAYVVVAPLAANGVVQIGAGSETRTVTVNAVTGQVSSP